MFKIVQALAFIIVNMFAALGWIVSYPSFVLFNILDSRSFKEVWAKSKPWRDEGK